MHTLLPSSDEASPVHPLRLPETCGSCHSDPAIAAKYGIPMARPIEAFQASVHSRTQYAASCNDCHGTHAIFSAADPRSMVNHQRVPATCGQCHEEITETFSASIHGKASKRGVREAPVCTDCHGEHRILSPSQKGSPVFATNLPKMTCGRCHGDVRLAEKYGIEAGNVQAYEDSFHGLAMRSGRATVANCASCHGVHDILPSSDPESHIHESRLAETCGQCHPGAGTRFAIGAVHVLQTDREHAAVYWVRMIYIWMIVVTVGGMILHNGLDFYRKFRNGIRHPHPDYIVTEERMMLGFRIAHILLMTSFAVLVYTGFALKYPESWWAAPLLRWEESFALRGWLHRAAAIVMLLAIGFHLVHLALSRRARSAIAMMRPSVGRRSRVPRLPAVLPRTAAAAAENARPGLSGEVGVHRVDVGHAGDDRDRVRAVVREPRAASAPLLGRRHFHGDPLLRGGSGHAGHRRLALLLRHDRPGRLPDGHRLADRAFAPRAARRARDLRSPVRDHAQTAAPQPRAARAAENPQRGCWTRSASDGLTQPQQTDPGRRCSILGTPTAESG